VTVLLVTNYLATYFSPCLCRKQKVRRKGERRAKKRYGTIKQVCNIMNMVEGERVSSSPSYGELGARAGRGHPGKDQRLLGVTNDTTGCSSVVAGKERVLAAPSLFFYIKVFLYFSQAREPLTTLGTRNPPKKPSGRKRKILYSQQ